MDELDNVSEQGLIERQEQNVVGMGNALAAIRDQRLFRDTHATFEDYCRERWKLEPETVAGMIAFAKERKK